MSNSNSDPNDLRPDFSIEEDDSMPDLPDPTIPPVILIPELSDSEFIVDQFEEYVSRVYRNVTPHPDGNLEVRWIEWDFRNDIPGSLELVNRQKDAVVDTWQAPGVGVVSDGVSTYTYGGQQFSEDGEYLFAAIRGDAPNDDGGISMPNQVRIEMRSRATNWSVVGQVDFPDPSHARNMDASFESTGNSEVLAFKIEGNRETTLHFVTWADGNLNISPAFKTEDPIPYSFGPVFSPDSQQYLIGNGSFDFGVAIYSWPECEKIGSVEWPKTKEALFIDRRHALILTQKGKLLLLDTNVRSFTQEWIIAGHAFDSENKNPKKSLCNISLTGNYLRATVGHPDSFEFVHVYADISAHQNKH